LVILSNCARQTQQPKRICPGEKSAAEVLSLLNSRPQNAVPLKAHGQCRLLYYAEAKLHKENFPVKLWMNPPLEIYLQGDVAFDAKGIALGSNKDEFWLSMRPKEISSYWRGRWSEQSCFEELMISPKLVLEALGVVEVSGEEYWSLSDEGAFNVLTKRDGDAGTQKIYVSKCDYLVSKIGHLDTNGKALIVIELGKYKEVFKGFFVPTVIRIIKPTAEDREDLTSVTLNLKSIKRANFTEKQRNLLFTPPQPRGVKHIYKISENCEVIEQPQ